MTLPDFPPVVAFPTADDHAGFRSLVGVPVCE